MKNEELTQKSTPQYTDDELLEMIHGALGEETKIDPSEIKVSIEEGNVTLTGTVFKKRDLKIAEQCTRKINGVKEVRNNIKISN